MKYFFALCLIFFSFPSYGYVGNQFVCMKIDAKEINFSMLTPFKNQKYELFKSNTVPASLFIDIVNESTAKITSEYGSKEYILKKWEYGEGFFIDSKMDLEMQEFNYAMLQKLENNTWFYSSISTIMLGDIVIIKRNCSKIN